jgi:hypothetical protein
MYANAGCLKVRNHEIAAAVKQACCIIHREEFMVKHQPGTSNMAYTSGNLQMHTDLPYYHHKPGVSKTISAVFKESSTDSIFYTEIKCMRDMYLFYAA